MPSAAAAHRCAFCSPAQGGEAGTTFDSRCVPLVRQELHCAVTEELRASKRQLHHPQRDPEDDEERIGELQDKRGIHQVETITLNIPVVMVFMSNGIFAISFGSFIAGSAWTSLLIRLRSAFDL